MTGNLVVSETYEAANVGSWTGFVGEISDKRTAARECLTMKAPFFFIDTKGSEYTKFSATKTTRISSPMCQYLSDHKYSPHNRISDVKTEKQLLNHMDQIWKSLPHGGLHVPISYAESLHCC
jgi:hypothetical protein